MHPYLKEIKDFLLANNIAFNDYNSFLDVKFKLPDKTIKVLISVNVFDELVLKYYYSLNDDNVLYKSKVYPVKTYKYDNETKKFKLGFSSESGEQNLTVEFVCNLMLWTKNEVNEINKVTDSLIFPF